MSPTELHDKPRKGEEQIAVSCTLACLRGAQAYARKQRHKRARCHREVLEVVPLCPCSVLKRPGKKEREIAESVVSSINPNCLTRGRTRTKNFFNPCGLNCKITFEDSDLWHDSD
jgi:hypothetical protein